MSQGGNRKSKVNHFPGATTETTIYVHDVENPGVYGSNSNRLMTYQIDNQQTGRLETVWYYYYYNDGNVERMVRNFDDETTMRATRLVYNKAVQTETADKDMEIRVMRMQGW